MLNRSSEDELDFDFKLQEEYGAGKTLWLIIPLWLLPGGFGAHRFYLGNKLLGLAMLGVVILMVIGGILIGFNAAVSGMNPSELEASSSSALGPVSVIGLVFSVWVFFDGVYVIYRKLTAKMSG